jgi:hypothetical protein
MGCKGLHCDGCNHHGARFGAGFGALVLLGAVLVYVGHRHAINHAASVAGDVMLIVLLVAAAAAVTAALAVTGVRVHRAIARRRERQMLAAPRVRVLPAHKTSTAAPALAQGRQRPTWPLPGWTPARPQIGSRRDDRHQ